MGDNEFVAPTPRAPTAARQPEGAAKDDQDLLSRGSSNIQYDQIMDATARTPRKKIPESVKREVFRGAQG